jgi:hypothetical protein
MDSTQNKPIPQVSHLLIPEPLSKERLDRAFLRREKDRETQMTLVNASNMVHNAGVRDYFSIYGAMSTRYGEDYVELYQVYGEDNRWAPMWGTRLYRSGAVTRRSVVVSYPKDGRLWLSWFESELRGTMIYAAEVYAKYGIDAERVRVLSVLRGAEELAIMVPGMLGMPVPRAPKAIEHLTVLPSRERITMKVAELRDDPEGVTQEMCRLLLLRYNGNPISMT